MLEVISEFINNLLNLIGTYGAILGCVFILFESIIPIIPLAIFITLNFETFGAIIGFIISWLFTVAGCMISYYIFKNGLSERLYNKFSKHSKLVNFMDRVSNMSFANLVLLLSIPFLPVFLINIAAGICKVEQKRFLYSLMIGKAVLVYFWGYIGTSLIDSLQNPTILIKVAIILIVTYVISRLLTKILKIK